MMGHGDQFGRLVGVEREGWCREPKTQRENSKNSKDDLAYYRIILALT